MFVHDEPACSIDASSAQLRGFVQGFVAAWTARFPGWVSYRTLKLPVEAYTGHTFKCLSQTNTWKPSVMAAV